MAIEIVDFLIKHGDFPWFFVCWPCWPFRVWINSHGFQMEKEIAGNCSNDHAIGVHCRTSVWHNLPHTNLICTVSKNINLINHDQLLSWSGEINLKSATVWYSMDFPGKLFSVFRKSAFIFWNVTQHTVLILKWSIILKYFRKVPFSKLTVRPWQSSGFCWSVSTQKWWKNQGPTVNLPESTYSLFLGIYQPELL